LNKQTQQLVSIVAKYYPSDDTIIYVIEDDLLSDVFSGIVVLISLPVTGSINYINPLVFPIINSDPSGLKHIVVVYILLYSFPESLVSSFFM
jgi:hypothetical protein